MKDKLTLIGLLALTLSVMMAGPGAAVSFTADAPNPQFNTEVTKDKHSIADMSPTEYENDQGEIEELNAQVDSDADNPYSFFASHVELAELGSFPADKDGVGVLDAAEWNSGSNATVSNVETANNVEAVNIATSNVVSGDSTHATFDNFTVTSDEDKRYLTISGDVNSIESGAQIEVMIIDADGDLKSVFIDPAKSYSDADVAATQTGDGFLFQAQLGELETRTGGTFNDIDQVQVSVRDANADISLNAVTLENTKPYVYGQESYEDADGNTQTRDVTERNAGVQVQTTSLDELGAQFDTAVIHGLDINMQFSAEDLDEGDVKSEYSEAESYPAYDQVANIEYRLTLPTAYDLTHSSVTLEETTDWPGDRYSSVEYIENVDADADWSTYDYSENGVDVTDSYGSQGSTVTLDDTVQPGQTFAVSYELLLTDDEADAMQGDDDSAGGPMGPESGIGNLPVIGAIAGLVAVLVGRVKGVF